MEWLPLSKAYLVGSTSIQPFTIQTLIQQGRELTGTFAADLNQRQNLKQYKAIWARQQSHADLLPVELQTQAWLRVLHPQEWRHWGSHQALPNGCFCSAAAWWSVITMTTYRYRMCTIVGAPDDPRSVSASVSAQGNQHRPASLFFRCMNCALHFFIYFLSVACSVIPQLRLPTLNLSLPFRRTKMLTNKKDSWNSLWNNFPIAWRHLRCAGSMTAHLVCSRN